MAGFGSGNQALGLFNIPLGPGKERNFLPLDDTLYTKFSLLKKPQKTRKKITFGYLAPEKKEGMGD